MPQPQPTPKQAPKPQGTSRQGPAKKETTYTFRDWASI